jgi:hypothetical protein
MKAVILLCDSAQVADGKLFILGGGWSIVGGPIATMALAIKLDVDWNEAEIDHKWELILVDADGAQVLVETPEGKIPIAIKGNFKVVKPELVPAGSPIDLALAINVGPTKLEPGNRYTWRLIIDDMTQESWSVSFYTKPNL